MSAIKDTIWKADPHTIAKITILKEYLIRYVQIIGRSFPAEMIYVDAFAGPGLYLNESEGSPLAALQAITDTLVSAGSEIVTRRILCIFIEKDPKRFHSLEEAIALREVSPKLQVVLINGEFKNVMAELESQIPQLFAATPSLLFIDPFGPTPVPFALIRKVLKNPKSEIILNFNASGIARIHAAGSDANHTVLLNEIFGDDKDWPRELGKATSNKAKEIASLSLYKKNIQAFPGVEYMYQFRMEKAADQLAYYLLCVAHHPEGLRKMKEAMRKINTDGSFTFSSDGQQKLFSGADESPHSERMHEYFSEKEATYKELDNFALNMTPLLNPKKMLARLERDNKISAKTRSGVTRRKGDFPEEKIESVTFKPYGKNLFD